MATKALSPLFRLPTELRAPSISMRSRPLQLSLTHQRRHFLPPGFNPLQPPTQTLHASRILPYPSQPIYEIIADVSNYRSFLPYCQSSTVTKWSSPDRTFNRKWPSEATLVVGWGQITESYTSRIFCVPGKVVEAVSGKTNTSLRREDIEHHLAAAGDEVIQTGQTQQEMALLTHLLTKWTVQPEKSEEREQQTQIDLSIEFAFANPLYATISAGVIPKLADVMIKAFEERVREVLGQADVSKGVSVGRVESGDMGR